MTRDKTPLKDYKRQYVNSKLHNQKILRKDSNDEADFKMYHKGLMSEINVIAVCQKCNLQHNA